MPDGTDNSAASERAAAPAHVAGAEAAATPPPAAALDTPCPYCGYNLRGLVSNRCPECGVDISNVPPGRPPIPWTQRRSKGRIRTYVRMLRFTLTQPRMFADHAAEPVSFRASQSFRWVTVHLTFVALALTGFDLIFLQDAPWSPFLNKLEWLLVPAVAVALWLTLAAWTGLPSYFFHPRRLPVARQNSLIALSYYTSAPLMLILLPVFVTVVPHTGNHLLMHAMKRSADNWSNIAISVGAGIAVALVCWYVNLLQLAARAIDVRRTIWLAVFVPIFWALAATLLVILPFFTYWTAAALYNWP